MIIEVGLRRIEVSHMAELRQLSIVYKDDPPTEQGRIFTSAVTVIAIDREGRYWRLDENGTEDGERIAGIYDVTDAT
jgi:hypothetical protein